jgi:CRISPR-associated protein Cmr6
MRTRDRRSAGGEDRPGRSGQARRAPGQASATLLPCPERMRQAWEAVRPDSGTHPVYWLSRMMGWKPKDGNAWGDADKRAALDKGHGAINAQVRQDLARHVLDRRREWLAPRERERTAHRLRLTATTDAVLWLASPGPLEVGLAFHHVYGFPVLPGSALKGLARRTARETLTEDVVKARYGATDETGPVAFLDGIPAGEWAVQRDVMTPHFMRWYRGDSGVLPDDTESPVPVGFLSIKAGSCFEAAVLARGLEEAAHLDGVIGDLRRGLDELGLGAKTAAGYGVFAADVVPPDPPERSSVGKEAAALGTSAPLEVEPITGLSREAVAVSEAIRSLRPADVKPRLAALVSQIERCPVEERPPLASELREQIRNLGFKAKEIREFVKRYPVLAFGEGG